MEKENYETYEYLPASGSNTEAEPYQFFVVQDDGTFLSKFLLQVNRQVQYVTQVQDVKETLEGEQACTMLDVVPQQFYVDIDSTTEMIAPDQFKITEGSSNLYTSSYLLQPGTATPADQIDNNVNEQPKSNLQAETSLPGSNKQVNSLTEITLTDEQYQMLEQKGWILLETNEKVYVLDTLGLHDITTNDKLIQKLKVDETTTNLEPESGQLKIEFSSSLGAIAVEIQNDGNDELKTDNHPELECTAKVSLMEDETKEQEINNKAPRVEETVSATADVSQTTEVDNLQEEVCDKWKDENVLRIRTDFCLKDIPDKIVLGKTKNGKRLICKVIKPVNNIVKPIKETAPEIDPVPSSETVQKSLSTGVTEDVDDDRLDSIFRKCFEDSAAQYNTEDITVTAKVIKQLLRLPAVKPSIMNRNMLVTKVTVNEIESRIIESAPTLVTGNVHLMNKDWPFLCKPELYAIAKKELSLPPNKNSIDHNFLHMHIHEILQNEKLVRTAVTLNKRRLEVPGTRHPEKIFIPDLPMNMTLKPPAADAENALYGYACATCAAIFRTEKDLEDHRETHKMDTDDKLTINTEEINFNRNAILVLADTYNKGRTYSCMHCNAKFQRLSNCQRHVKTHMVTADKAMGVKNAYKCKICHSVFHHAPTLLKHIMKRHIKVEK